jgi:hypothetical protein
MQMLQGEGRLEGARLDPREKLVTLVLAQHLPYDQHGLFWRSSTLVYSAITD